MQSRELLVFEQNITYAQDLAATASALAQIVTPAVDVTDLYRAAFMQGVSAFDFFMHEEIRARMLDLHSRPRAEWPAGFSNFKVPIAQFSIAAGNAQDAALSLEAEIRNQHGHLSFQHPDKVAAACRHVSDIDIWSAVADSLGTTRQGRLTAGQVAKKDWGLIIDRRNLIVHEADLDPTPPRNRRYTIDAATTTSALSHIQLVARAISNSLSAN